MTKRLVRAAAVQVKPIETSVKKTILQAVRLARRAAEKNADIICFPEHWLPEKQIPTPVDPLPELQSLAEEYGCSY